MYKMYEVSNLVNLTVLRAVHITHMNINTGIAPSANTVLQVKTTACIQYLLFNSREKDNENSQKHVTGSGKYGE